MCLLTVAEGTPFQADASDTAQLNIIHMLDKRGGLNRSMQHFSKSICSVQSKLKRMRVLIQAECRPGWSNRALA
jgi:hypothetical protein